MIPYVIRSGDHLLSIAHRCHFDAAAVWGDPANDTIRALRGDGSILAPGDVLMIPEPTPPKWLKATTGSVNRYVVTVPRISVELRISLDGAPHANASYTVTCERATTTGSTGTNGAIQFEAPVYARVASIQLDPPGIQFVALIGLLDPVDTGNGLLQRLRNLGHLPYDAWGYGDERERGIANFQEDAGLPVTGEFDAATTDALLKAHRC